MKTHQISSIQLASRHDSYGSRGRRILPAIDCGFQFTADIQAGIGMTPRKNNASSLRKFRQLSAEFLGPEMSRDYRGEIILFILIAGVSAWPVIAMMAALAQMTK